MLAFDDAALARLVIAASRIAPARRGRWLRRRGSQRSVSSGQTRSGIAGGPAGRGRYGRDGRLTGDCYDHGLAKASAPEIPAWMASEVEQRYFNMMRLRGGAGSGDPARGS